MAKLPALTARKVVRALKRAGFVEDRHIKEPLLRGIIVMRISLLKTLSICCKYG